MGASASVIPITLYEEIMHDIAPAKLEDIDVTIKLANRDTISAMGIVRDVEVLCGKTKYPADFLVLGSPQDSFCPIIFGRPFLNTVNATIDCTKNVVTVGLDDMVHEFNFSKFSKQHREEEFPSKDEIIGLASISVPPSDPLEQYLLDHENCRGIVTADVHVLGLSRGAIATRKLKGVNRTRNTRVILVRPLTVKVKTYVQLRWYCLRFR